ncbi:uncharacterized protein AB675_7736 [Cyphellophora attinorum]|uniref:Uncharacterized protein n=1 Tax=Cyphellophora attinorum TaxID=1664694 RepID=A0A0N1HUD9_9EURO|nr:uncharacterized protein AB675_7736 [Phialophora attinorum]KPI40516.1 hypothetical protein AB675_7736 [Phialophora attinorum]
MPETKATGNATEYLEKCDRTLAGMPSEILRLILHHVLVDDAVITCTQTGTGVSLNWSKRTAPDLIFVSKRFGAVAKDVIAEEAIMVYNAEHQAKTFLDAICNGAQQDWEDTLNLSPIPEHIRSKSQELRIYQRKLLRGGVCDRLDVNSFPSLRKVDLVVDNIEDWANNFNSTLLYIAAQGNAFVQTVQTKLTSVVETITNPDYLSVDVARELKTATATLLALWRIVSRSMGITSLMPIVLQEALSVRMRAGHASTEALLIEICERHMGIARSRVDGLLDHTLLAVHFTTRVDGTSKAFATVTFSKDETRAVVEPDAVDGVLQNLSAGINDFLKTSGAEL